jgi:lysozyme
MNLISKIVIGVLILNVLGLAVVSYKIMGGDLKNKVNHMIGDSQNKEIPKSKNTTLQVSEDNSFDRQDNDLNTHLKGIDVSHWNGNIVEDLPSKDELKFVICKSTQGENDIDPDFEKNWNFLKEKDILKGTYHFYVYPLDPIKQADHFCNTVGEIKAPDFPLIIDIEELSLPRKAVDYQKLQKDILKFLKHVEKKTNRTPMIYSDYSFLKKYLNHPVFSKYPLWLAEYSHLPKPNIPEVWKRKGCVIWQKTDHYQINSDESDYDVFYN